MRLTAPRPRLEPMEVATTALAVAVSTAAFLRYGRHYLARGVVGDLAGLGVLAGVLVLRRRRARHEAAVCLSFIGIVAVLRPEWPLRYGSRMWWASVAVGLGAYLGLRRRVLGDAFQR